MGCSSTNEELEAKINKLIDKRNEIRKLKKRKIRRLEKLTNEKFNKDIVPDCYIETENKENKEKNEDKENKESENINKSFSS